MLNKHQIINALSILKPQLKKEFEVDRIGIFGSVAKNNFSEHSDVDIFFEGKPMSLLKNYELKKIIETNLNKTVDLVRMRKTMNITLKNQILKYGIYV